MENMMGKCEYCGAQIGVMAATQEEANKIAEEQCGCAGGRRARKKENMKEKLDALIGEQCPPELNPVDQVVYDTILTVGCMIIDGIMQSATFKIDGTTVTVKAGKKIEVTRRRVYEQGAEVQE